jgi:hypothetical protein
MGEPELTVTHEVVEPLGPPPGEPLWVWDETTEQWVPGPDVTP